MKFNHRKFQRLHMDQQAGWRQLRAFSSSMDFERDQISVAQARMSRHPVAHELAAKRPRDRIRPDLLKDFVTLEMTVAAARKRLDRLQVEYTVLEVVQQDRGQLLARCTEFLTAMGIDPDLIDTGDHYRGPPMRADIELVGGRPVGNTMAMWK